MAKILILFAHPRLEKSLVQRSLLEETSSLDGVTVHDLYQKYPDFDVDIYREQELLLTHEVIILQHPLYWYSVPPLLKQWIDLVLQHGWAYGAKGDKLAGKFWMHALSSGGPVASYSKEGFHGYTLEEFLRPLQRTATLCKMKWLPPFTVHGAHRLDDHQIRAFASDYRRLLELLRDERISFDEAAGWERMNSAINFDKPA